MSAPQGVVIALVQDVEDPLAQGRVLVTYPWLPEEVGGWAPVARPMAGKGRGYFYVPEVGDEALVAFEQGDVDHPFVVGFLHNGVDVPPDQDADRHVRRIRSVAGHVVDLDDRSGQERVLVRSNGGHQVELRDSDDTAEVRTEGGQRVTLTDTPAQVEVSTAGGTSVTLSDGPSQVVVSTAAGVTVTVSDTGVSVDSAAGPVTLTCPTATVNATASCTVTAPSIALNGSAVSVNSALTTFSGVVVCTSLVANAVAAAAYSPGVGNLL